MSKKKKKVPQLSMKWYYALIYTLLPLFLLFSAYQILRDIFRLCTGNTQSFFTAGRTPLPVTPPLVTLMVFQEIIVAVTFVIGLLAWFQLIKKKKRGVSLYLICCILAVVNGVCFPLKLLMVRSQIFSFENTVFFGIVLVISAVLLIGGEIAFFILNRIYFQKRESFFE